MKKIISFLVALTLFYTVAVSHAKTYINGFDAINPPFAYLDKQGNATGFDIESINWIAKKMGFKIKHQPIAWNVIIPALLNKKIDMICSGMSISEDRVQVIDFSEPYFRVKKYIVLRKDSEYSLSDILNSSSKIGVQKGTTDNELLEAKKAKEDLKFDVITFDSIPLAINGLLRNRLDAVASDSSLLKKSLFKEGQIKIAGTYAKDEEYGVALRKNNTKLRKLINEGYKMLKSDPFWKKLEEKYF